MQEIQIWPEAAQWFSRWRQREKAEKLWVSAGRRAGRSRPPSGGWRPWRLLVIVVWFRSFGASRTASTESWVIASIRNMVYYRENANNKQPYLNPRHKMFYKWQLCSSALYKSIYYALKCHIKYWVFNKSCLISTVITNVFCVSFPTQ